MNPSSHKHSNYSTFRDIRKDSNTDAVQCLLNNYIFAKYILNLSLFSKKYPKVWADSIDNRLRYTEVFIQEMEPCAKWGALY